MDLAKISVMGTGSWGTALAVVLAHNGHNVTVWSILEDEVEISLLSKAIRKLSPREQTIIRLRFGLGKENAAEKTQKEVADLLGISQSYISRLEKRIMKRLKKEIVKYE